VDIESLKLFCDVIRLKSFARAGAANSITQSAVSQRLNAFEKGFGVPLLERRGSQLRLTDAGEVVYRGAKRILAKLREIEEHLQEISFEGHIPSRRLGRLAERMTISAGCLWIVVRLIGMAA